MMMSARPMHVAVRELLAGGLANVRDLDVEVERFARKWMVHVHGDHVALQAHDRRDTRLAARSLCLELHARRDLVAAERSTRHLLDEFLVALAVTVGRRNLDVELVARRLALELLLEPRDDVSVTVNVGERLAT